VRLSVIRNNEVVGQVQIDKARTLGQGATAEIFAVDFDGRACAAKIYLDPSAFNEAKILSMLGNPPGGLYTSLHGRNYPLFAWPEAILSDSGKAVGFLMPAIDPNHAFPLDFYFDKTLFNRLGSPSEAALSYRLEIAANLSSLIAGLHAQGHHFIDIKPQNIRVLRGIHVVTLVDCDGFSICSLSGARYPAELMSTDYVAPEAFRSHASPGSLGEQQDRYALAVILFQLLNGGTHPFQGILGDRRAQAATNDEKAAAGLYPHGLAINPLIAPRPSSTHACWLESTRVLFDRAFIGGEDDRPSASDWSDHFNELLSTKALVRCDVRPNDLGHMCFRDKPCAGCLSEAASSSAPAPLPAFTRAPAVSPPVSPPQPVAGDTQGDLATLIVVALGILVGVAAIILLATAGPGARREGGAPASSLGSQVSEGATSQGMPGAGPSFGASTPAPAQSTDTLDTAAGAAQTAVEPEDIAWAAYSRGDYATALSLWRSLADQGDANAQYTLGYMYDNGEGVPENDVEAVRWYRLAAGQGLPSAQTEMGFMYANGEGVPENDVEAVLWYRLAADQGDAQAQHNLGFMYANGEGARENDVEAVRLYRLAADQGLATAQYNLGLMYAKGEGVPKNDAEAVRWFRLAGDQGLARAQHNLGFMYDNGEGVQQNDVEAVRWYRLAAVQGDANAQYNLGLMYTRGMGVEPSYVEALKWFRMAADQGNVSAQRAQGAAEAAVAAEASQRVSAIEPTMIRVPGGTFLMGSPPGELGRSADEGPQRSVTIQPFEVSKHEVTWVEYAVCVSAGSCPAALDDGFGKGDRPVTNVSWDDANKFVSWLSRETGKTYRLLSEAEWEYAARAGTTTAYSFGDSISNSQANYSGGLGKTTPVGTFPANAFGLHDMHGNVYEWVEDCYADNHSAGQPSDGRAYTSGSCSLRVYRGGSWNYYPQYLRSADRNRFVPMFRGSTLGFRVARNL
jgi:TPR repeat protein